MNGTEERALMGELVGTTPAELAAAAFIAGYPNPITRDAYALHMRDWFGFCRSHDIDPMICKRVHIELWIRSLESRGLKPRTRALKISVIRGFYNYCVDEDWLDVSPAQRIKRPDIPRKSPRGALGRTQLAELVEGARAIGPHQAGMVMLLGFNGLRISEACAANVEHMVWDGFSPVLWIPARKGGNEGTAAISRPLEELLKECIGDRTEGPLLLNQAGNRMTRSNVQRILDRAKRNCRGRLPALSPHVLRHTWCTLALDAGAPLTRVQHDGGWADTRMAEYYNHQRHDPINSATHLVAAHVMSVS